MTSSTEAAGPRLQPASLLILTLVLAAGASGCSKHDKDERHDASTEVTGVSAQPLPPMPAWSKDMIEKPVIDVFHNTTKACRGALDIVKVSYTGTPQGVQIAGWAWDDTAKAPTPRVIFLDDSDLIVGAGETTMNRPDVQKVLPDVTSAAIGWLGEVDQKRGNVRAMAILKDGSICQVGAKIL